MPNLIPNDVDYANYRRDMLAGIAEPRSSADAEEQAQHEVLRTLDRRGQRYGDFARGSQLACELKDTLRRHPGYAFLVSGHRQALDIIMDKVSRIINGDPMYADNWHDIAGYATLGEQICSKD